MTPSVRPARQESRARILAVLREAERPLGISALTEDTGLSAGAVRFHLANLVRAGSVRGISGTRHSGPGRPVVEYEALPADPGDPAEAYRMLAAMLGRRLSESGEPRAAYEAGRQWAREASSGADRPASAALEVAQRLFREGGFDPVVGADGRTVELHRCPFYGLAAELPSVVCAVHEGLTAGALENAGMPAHVRVVPVLDGSGPCLVHLYEGSPAADRVSSASAKEILP